MLLQHAACPGDTFVSRIPQQLSFAVLIWATRSEFCHHTKGKRKLHFLRKALTCNRMTYKSTMMIPIRSDRKSMPINCRTLNQCYGIPMTTVFIFTFTTKTKHKLKPMWLKKKTQKNLTSDSSLSAVKFTPYYYNKEKSKQNHSETATTSAKTQCFFQQLGLCRPVFRHFRATFSTAGFFFIYVLKSC